MLIQKPFYFLRHGETNWNKEGRYQGQQDIPLNPRGISQAEKSRSQLVGQPFSEIHSSTLIRAKATAEIVNASLQLPLYSYDSLRECNYGELEGQLKTDPTLDSRWRAGYTPQAAESYQEFSIRVIKAVNEILSSKETALIVAHRAVFWPIADTMGLSKGIDLSNAQPIYLDPPSNNCKDWLLKTDF
ncbi:histidine phosphatase family protein [Kiloniella sp.]|uniref:histidine phosphatase family protein n=1 Tax=Kiloniella sp. TaxID=1938587 RepID=UPI003B02BF6E